MSKFGNVEIIIGHCHVSTVKDGRGAICSWIPKAPILEFNLVVYAKDKIRGNHYHPEFDEYILIVDGTFYFVTKDPSTGDEISMIASKGTCFYIPRFTPHTLVASDSATLVSFLTKPWDECEEPIIRESLVPQDSEYKNYAKSQGFEYSAEELKNNKGIQNE